MFAVIERLVQEALACEAFDINYEAAREAEVTGEGFVAVTVLQLARTLRDITFVVCLDCNRRLMAYTIVSVFTEVEVV